MPRQEYVSNRDSSLTSDRSRRYPTGRTTQDPPETTEAGAGVAGTGACAGAWSVGAEAGAAAGAGARAGAGEGVGAGAGVGRRIGAETGATEEVDDGGP